MLSDKAGLHHKNLEVKYPKQTNRKTGIKLLLFFFNTGMFTFLALIWLLAVVVA